MTCPELQALVQETIKPEMMQPTRAIMIRLQIDDKQLENDHVIYSK